MENGTSAEIDESQKEHLIIVCLTDHPKAMTLLRIAQTRALEMKGYWRAVFIETPDYERLAEDGAKPRLLRILERAKQMGGQIQHIHAETMEKGIIALMHEEKEHLALLVTGDSRVGQYHAGRPASEMDNAIRTARKQHIAVEIVTLSQSNYRQSLMERLRWIKPADITYSLLAVGFALTLASLLEHYLPPALFRINNQNVGFLFMIASAFAAGRFGLLPGMLASIAGFLILNYYFTLPYHSLKFDNLTDTLNMMLFLSTAVLISLFTSQTHGYAKKAARRELNTQALFTLYRLAANASSRKQALHDLQQKLTHMLKMEVAFFIPTTPNGNTVAPAYEENTVLSETDKLALALSWSEIKTTGLASPFYPESTWRFEPMVAPAGEIGVLGIKPKRKGQIDAWFGGLLTAIADQTATVLDHIELERTIEATHIREEREKLRSMLLSSVSHDLKTPLASIIGALSIYRSQGKKLSVEKQELLIETALQESERLDSFITNILDMTHLESGKIEFKQEWGDMHGMVNHAVKRLEHRLRQHKLIIHAPPKNIEVLLDMMMVEQVLQNVLDNACKYTPAGTQIDVNYIAEEGNHFICEIRDHGMGLPPEKLDRVFDKYARLHKQDFQVAGTGLGLAICKAMMEAQGGGITAANHAGGGAVFRLTFPRWRKADTTKYVA